MPEIEKNDVTNVWKLYEMGRNYNQALTPNQYNLVETNVEFYTGNQWLRLPSTPAMRGLPKPTFNILKRVSKLFIASLMSSAVAIRYEPLAYYDGSGLENPDKDLARMTSAMVNDLLDKLELNSKLRKALNDGAMMGDYCAHFYFDPDAIPYGGAYGPYRGEIKMELLDGINVMFGNPHSPDVQSQPYILLVGRAPVEQLREEARRFKANKDRMGKAKKLPDKLELEQIQPDAEWQYFPGVGGKVELLEDNESGQCLYGVLYTKVMKEEDEVDKDGNPVMEDVLDADGNPVFETDADGDPLMDPLGMPVPKQKQARKLVTSVHVTKATRTSYIYEDVDTGLSLYPIAWGNWEEQKNQYHGRALVTGMIPNQIFINTMFATAMRHLQLMAFPKTIYNADLISAWTNEVGQAIGVHGLQPGVGISSVAMNLQPAEMSNQIFALIDKAMEYTKECLGATDAQMGNVKAENTSAIMVLQTNSEVPLENVRAGMNSWVRAIGNIIPDMMGTYYGTRPVIVEDELTEIVTDPSSGMPVLDPYTGMMQTKMVRRKVKRDFDFSRLKLIPLNSKIDVGATTYYSEIAMTQTLDNLRKDGTLDVIQYLERIPDKLIPKKEELINEIKARVAAGTQANAGAGQAIPEPGSPVAAGPVGPDIGPVPVVPNAAMNLQGEGLTKENALQGLPTQSEALFEKMPNITKKTNLYQGALRAE